MQGVDELVAPSAALDAELGRRRTLPETLASSGPQMSNARTNRRNDATAGD